MRQDATREFMYGKIHRCRVTQADLDQVGSITLDPALLRAAGIFPHTRVDVVNITNGARLSTYVIEGQEESGVVGLNGAAARIFTKGDLASIMAFEQVPVAQIGGRISRSVHVNGENKVSNIDKTVTSKILDSGD
jgi:aspartate 1-decarboxylase